VKRCSSTLPLTSVLERHWFLTQPTGRFNPFNEPIPILWQVGWAPGPIWGGAENLAAIGIRFPDRQARGKSDVFRSRAF
jgi:hypothetical protein